MYTISSNNLPSYVKKLSEVSKKKWVAIFNMVAEQKNEETALIVANKWLKRQITKEEVVANTKNTVKLERIVFTANDNQLIKRTDGGDEYVEFILTDTGINSLGESYSEEILQQWADDINKGVFVGDVDHEEYDKILRVATTSEQAASLIKNTKRGIAKTLKAIYENGKLWVKAIIDKRYKKVIEKAKGVSLEAFVEKDANNKVISGDLLGFTFAVNDNPVNSRAVIA